MGQWAGKIPGKPDLPDDTHLAQVHVVHGGVDADHDVPGTVKIIF